jgi:hypothetical protein
MLGLPSLEDVAQALKDSNEELLRKYDLNVKRIERWGELLLWLSFFPLAGVVAGMLGVSLPGRSDIFSIACLLLLPLVGFFLLNRAAWPARSLKQWRKKSHGVSWSRSSPRLAEKPDKTNVGKSGDAIRIKEELEDLRKDFGERIDRLSARLERLSAE